MNIRTVVYALVYCLFVWSYFYSLNQHFEEPVQEAEIQPTERKEFCFDTNFSILDLWNNRYLHIDSSNNEFELFSKRTFFFEMLKNKHVADKIQKKSGMNPFSLDIRMYFSHCYIVENTSTSAPIQLSLYTYRKFCYWNATLMLLIIGFALFKPKMIIKDIVFFGISFVAFFVAFSSAITYLPNKLIHLPGFRVINEGLWYSVFVIAFYSVFVVSICSFLLRLAICYCSFSYTYLHSIPRIISTIGPYICHYQEWVIGLYIAIALFIIPFNKEWLWFISIIGIILTILLWVYGTSMIKANLLGGLIIAILIDSFVYASWVMNYKQVFSQSIEEKKKD